MAGLLCDLNTAGCMVTATQELTAAVPCLAWASVAPMHLARTRRRFEIQAPKQKKRNLNRLTSLRSELRDGNLITY